MKKPNIWAVWVLALLVGLAVTALFAHVQFRLWPEVTALRERVHRLEMWRTALDVSKKPRGG